METFYLTMHSKLFYHSYTALDMVKDHAYNERGNLLPPLHGLLVSTISKGYLLCTIQKIG